MTRQPVFADTSAWYALFVATDPRHAQAQAIYRRLREGLVPLVCSDWVMVETVALLHRRVGTAAAAQAAAALAGTGQVRVVWIEEDMGHEAVGRFLSLKGSVSFVDAASFVVMERLGISQAFAFDSDFATQGFALIEEPHG